MAYFNGLPDFKQLRLKLVTSTDLGEIDRVLDTILERYRDYDDLS